MKNNNQKLYDLVIYIGRFQPFHNGHCAALTKATELSNNVLTLIGSAIGPRTIRNPWNFDERRTIIRDTILPHLDEQQQTLQIEGLRDYTYNDNKWVEQVGLKVNNAIKRFGGDTFAALGGKPKIAVIGHDKDHTSSYLNYFPQWDFIEVEAYPSESDIIDSTRIRQLMFTGKVSFTDSVVPGDQVRKFMRSKHFHELAAEWEYIENYKKAASVAPHETQYITVDAVVEQSGHILLVKRGGFPGKGLWALPGGFLDPHERIFEGALRELTEETGLKVPEKVLRGSLKDKDYFDDPNRSLRGRTVTHAFYFKLDDTAKLPRTKAGSDAAETHWFSLAEFTEMQGVMFEDHYHVATNMLGRG